MIEEETKVNAEEISGISLSETAEASSVYGEPPETEIRDTDIVFDCPHCGHNLAIDYRGAGLQITCVKCGKNVLVPIPDGMKIDDLDIEPGDILKQLFAARRNLQRAEFRIAELQEELEKKEAERASLQGMLEVVQRRINEAREVYAKQVAFAQKTADLLNDMDEDLLPGDADVAEDVGFSADEVREDGAQSE